MQDKIKLILYRLKNETYLPDEKAVKSILEEELLKEEETCICQYYKNAFLGKFCTLCGRKLDNDLGSKECDKEKKKIEYVEFI
jgi:hypothetical protein